MKELGKEAKESFEEMTREEADGTSIYVMAVIDITDIVNIISKFLFFMLLC